MSFCSSHYSVKKNKKKKKKHNFPEGVFLVISTFLPATLSFGGKLKPWGFRNQSKHEKNEQLGLMNLKMIGPNHWINIALKSNEGT